VTSSSTTPHHEERVAVRSPVHGGRELGEERVLAETPCQVRRDVRLAEERERKLLALTAHPKLLGDRA